MGEPVLDIRALTKSFGALVASDNVSLTIMPGEIHALIGPNGAGKSTLIKQIMGELAPDSGQVLFNGQDVSQFSAVKRARAGMARSFQVSDRVTLRPFVEGQAGIETFVRAGFDLTFGDITRGEMLVRDSTTGQRYRVVQHRDATGFGFVVGADIARVSDSVFLPSDRGYDLTPRRDRVRAGVHWQGKRASAFYGLTWLGKEYETQPDHQLVGSVRIKIDF